MKLIFLVFVCKVFASELKDCFLEKNSNAEIVSQEDVKYDRLNWQANIRKRINPIGYILPKSTEDIKNAIECGNKLNLHFAIQSGGHSFEKYSYGTNKSWVLLLTLMNKMEFDKKTNQVVVGSGIRTGELTNYLWMKYKRAVPVGHCSHVGVAGYALGGGVGMISPKRGLLTDVIVEMEIVTADAKVLSVNKDSNPDLFWALRGAGGGNFGVVTEFTFSTFDASHEYIWIRKEYKKDMFTTALQEWHNYLASRNSSSVGGNLYWVYEEMIIWLVIDEDDIIERDRQLEIIKNFIPSINEDDISRGTYKEYQSLPVWNGTDIYHYLKEKSIYVNRYLNNSEIDRMLSFYKKYPYISYLFDIYGGIINNHSRNETAFIHRSSIYDIQISISFPILENENITNSLQFGERFRRLMNIAMSELDFLDSGESYQNYIDEDRPDWFKRYYGENGERLMQIKAKYDSDNFFRFGQSLPLFVEKVSKTKRIEL